MRLPVRSYSEAAARAGVTLCRGITPSGVIDLTDCDHDRGTIVGGTLHWRDRQVRRSGLWRFAMLAGRMQADQIGNGPWWAGAPHWQKLYFETIAAYRVGLMIGIRFRREEMADAKARVRTRLLTTHIHPNDRKLAVKVANWARRDA